MNSIETAGMTFVRLCFVVFFPSGSLYQRNTSGSDPYISFTDNDFFPAGLFNFYYLLCSETQLHLLMHIVLNTNCVAEDAIHVAANLSIGKCAMQYSIIMLLVDCARNLKNLNTSFVEGTVNTHDTETTIRIFL